MQICRELKTKASRDRKVRIVKSSPSEEHSVEFNLGVLVVLRVVIRRLRPLRWSHNISMASWKAHSAHSGNICRISLQVIQRSPRATHPTYMVLIRAMTSRGDASLRTSLVTIEFISLQLCRAVRTRRTIRRACPWPGTPTLNYTTLRIWVSTSTRSRRI